MVIFIQLPKTFLFINKTFQDGYTGVYVNLEKVLSPWRNTLTYIFETHLVRITKATTWNVFSSTYYGYKNETIIIIQILLSDILLQKLLVLLFMTSFFHFPFFSIILHSTWRSKYIMQALELIYRRSWKLVWHIKTLFPSYTCVFFYIVWICKYKIKPAFSTMKISIGERKCRGYVFI